MATHDVMDSVNTTWQRVAGSDHIKSIIDSLIAHYDFEQPQKSIDGLTTLYKTAV